MRGALLGVGVFFAFVMYGLVAGFHLNTGAGLKAFFASPAQFSTLASQYARWLRQPVDLAAIAGLFSCMLAVLNTTVRVVFAMARGRVLPPQLSRVHRRFMSPCVAIYTLVGFSVIVGVLLSVWLGSGLTDVYGYAGSIGTIAIILVYGLANLGQSPEKLAALGATMATDEIDFAEARSTSLSPGGSPELPGPEVP